MGKRGRKPRELPNPKCPFCGSKTWRRGLNPRGKQRFRCSNQACGKNFNESYGTIFWWKQHEDKVVIISCLLYSLFPLSFDQVSFILKLFGIDVSYFAIYYWINQLGKDIEKIKKHYRIRFKKIWHADEKYVKYRKEWVYQLNLIDSKGNVIASFVSKERDEGAAKLLMKLGLKEANKKPEILVTDGNKSYKKARKKLGKKTRHVIAGVKDKQIIHKNKILTLSNKPIEAFHSRLSRKLRQRECIKSIEKHNLFLKSYGFFYNFFSKKKRYRAKALLKKFNLPFNIQGITELFYKI